jgi:hypothetical protein
MSKTLRVKNKDGKFIKTHGMTSSPTYRSWGMMIQRCTNPKHSWYKLYGGKGIKIIDKWLDFKNFLADMGERPVGKSLDRIDGNLNYCKENCRWATPKEQSRNRTNRRIVEYDGNNYGVTELCEMLKIERQSFYNFLHKGKQPSEIIKILLKRQYGKND